VFNFAQKELATKAYEIDRKNEFSALPVSGWHAVFVINVGCLTSGLLSHMQFKQWMNVTTGEMCKGLWGNLV
jgi:hypothetical protein